MAKETDKKITKLTKEQEDQIPGWVDKWIKIGLSTDPANFEVAENAAMKLYELCGMKRPKLSLRAGSPFSAAKMFLDEKIKMLGHEPTKEEKESIKNYIFNIYKTGNLWAGWYAYITFFKDVVGLKFDNLNFFELDKEIAVNAGWSFWDEDIFIITDRPSAIRLNSEGRPHADMNPAIEYRDGWKLYFLNGINMDENQVMTPSNKLDPRDIIKEINVDRRRELIRKIGIERMMEQLPHKVMNKKGNYELVSIDLDDRLKGCKYLKMKNPSIGVWHLEGVGRECNTVQEAINWRKDHVFGDDKSDWDPKILT